MQRRLTWAALVLLSASALSAVAGTAQGDRRLPTGLTFDGDFRVRYEANSATADGPERHRGVLRGRLGVRYEINSVLTAGARLVTGDAGDPRTADVTLGDFVDDLEVSLDRAYLAASFGHGGATAGKAANPFVTTELVWDNDVNPPGIAGWVEGPAVAGWTPRATGLLMVVDEQALGDDSSMYGLQVGASRGASEGWGVELAAAYWDYDIPSLAGAHGAGDYRGNYLTPDGSRFLSDFNLADLVVAVHLPGPSPAMPLRIVADYVRNLGAEVDEDEGFWLDLTLGREWRPGGWALRYGYAECETDAVLGAFSNDNLPLATNYRSHTVRAAYGLLEDTSLSLTWYYFEQLEDGPRDGATPDGYRSRARLDLMVRF